jgi:hypothetical protein
VCLQIKLVVIGRFGSKLYFYHVFLVKFNQNIFLIATTSSTERLKCLKKGKEFLVPEGYMYMLSVPTVFSYIGFNHCDVSETIKFLKTTFVTTGDII